MAMVCYWPMKQDGVECKLQANKLTAVTCYNLHSCAADGEIRIIKIYLELTIAGVKHFYSFYWKSIFMPHLYSKRCT